MVVEAIAVVEAGVVMGAAVVVEAIVVVGTVVAVGSRVVTGGGGMHTQLKLDEYKPSPALHNLYVPIPLQEWS